MDNLTGQHGEDGGHALRGGFRTDSSLSSKDALTLEGNVYTEREGELAYFLPSLTSPGLTTIPDEITSAGGFIQANWKHRYSDRADSELQTSFTHYTRDDPLEPEERSTLYVDYQDHFAWGARQDVIWGIGDLYTSGQINGTLIFSIRHGNRWTWPTPSSRTILPFFRTGYMSPREQNCSTITSQASNSCPASRRPWNSTSRRCCGRRCPGRCVRRHRTTRICP